MARLNANGVKDTRIAIGTAVLRNPVIAASGCYNRGAEYAALLLEYLAAPVVDPGTLGMVAVDMGSEVNGLTVGFWCHIGIAAAAGRQHAVRVREWWHEQEIIYQAREASERSERARKAARARWAKARDG